MTKEEAAGWQPIETAPKDRDILVWCDHDADHYLDPVGSGRLTPYSTWCEHCGYPAARGVFIARYLPQYYYMPAAWRAREMDKYDRVVIPTYWMPLPEAPQ